MKATQDNGDDNEGQKIGSFVVSIEEVGSGENDSNMYSAAALTTTTNSFRYVKTGI